MSVSRREVQLPWETFPDCPCSCGAQGLKLQTRHDKHLVGCVCRVCTGRRSKYKGRKAQHQAHRLMGGVGWSPSQEESARPYDLSLTVMPEVKSGKQVNATFGKFITSAWFRHALAQSEKAAPFGTGVVPAVVLRVPGSKQMWIVAKL